MAKKKAGLHKKVSSIFGGVLVQSDNAAPGPPPAPVPERPKDKPRSERKREHSEPPAPAKEPAQTYMTSTTLQPQERTKPQPKAPPPEPPKAARPKQPKAARPKQPKARVAIKIAKQIPWRETWQKIESRFFAPKPGVDVKRQKMMVVLIPVLFIILIFVFSRVLRTPSRAKATPPVSKLLKAVAVSNNERDWQIPAPYPTTLRDPMQFGSVTTTHAGTGGLIVKGIVYSEDKPAAVIGTQIVGEGEKVLGATVVKINEGSVEFEMKGKKWTQKVQ